jgi:hypothetical protein
LQKPAARFAFYNFASNANDVANLHTVLANALLINECKKFHASGGRQRKAINFAPVDAFIAHARDVIYVNAAAKLWHCVYRVVRIQSHTHEKTSSQVSLRVRYCAILFYLVGLFLRVLH